MTKEAFHRNSKKALWALATALGLEKDEYDLRSNMGGVAVCGEITLHTDTLYVQIFQPEGKMLVRTCEGRKDYGGGGNNYMDMALLNTPEELAKKIQQFLQVRKEAKERKIELQKEQTGQAAFVKTKSACPRA